MKQSARVAEIEGHLYQVLELLGLDLTSEGLRETPKRVTKYLFEFNQAFKPSELLKGGFEAPGSHSSLIVQSPVPFRMMCEHHLLPALGFSSIGYIPNKRVIGLSKIPRLVDAVGTERPSIQEAIGDRIADILCEQIEPRGVIVVLNAEHTCMACRGVTAPGVVTTTSSVRGVFRDVPQARSEFFSLIHHGGNHA